MTVRELIHELEKVDPDRMVVIDAMESGTTYTVAVVTYPAHPAELFLDTDPGAPIPGDPAAVNRTLDQRLN